MKIDLKNDLQTRISIQNPKEMTAEEFYNKLEELHEQPGLTKREYFAAKAMQGFIRFHEGYSDGTIAEFSVRMADQLIQELNK